MVHNDGHGLWAEGEAWQLTEDLRISSLDAKELRVFDDTGRHVRTIGRPGQGPGEFEQPVRVDIGPDPECHTALKVPRQG